MTACNDYMLFCKRMNQQLASKEHRVFEDSDNRFEKQNYIVDFLFTVEFLAVQI